MLRVIAGKYKRTQLYTLEGEEVTRPTRDMVREAYFSSIMINSDTLFLDLFSGSGAIGIEALSRGAKDVVFNDINIDAVKIIRRNLDKLHEERKVYNLDYQTCLEKLKGNGFDHIYLDPPYAFDEFEKVFELLKKYEILSKNGIVTIEVRKDHDLKESYEDMVLYKERRYGINKLLYYKEKKDD